MSTLLSVSRKLIVYKPCGFFTSFLAMCSLNFSHHCVTFYLYMANKYIVYNFGGNGSLQIIILMKMIVYK